jgi:hypothetical protein
MRDYGVVSPKFWIGETGKALRGQPEAQLVALYLMTCPHANMIGVFHCPLIYISHETGISFEGASKALTSLSEAQFCTYDEATETVFVHRMAAYQVGESLKAEDNRVKSVVKEWQNIAPGALQQAFAAIYSEAFHLPVEAKKTRASKAPSKPLRSQEQEQDKNKTPSGPSPFEVFYDAYPKKEAKKDAAAAFAKLNPDPELLAKMLAAIAAKRQSHDWTKDGGKFVPLPATWIRAERWNDESGVETRTADIWAGAV